VSHQSQLNAEGYESEIPLISAQRTVANKTFLIRLQAVFVTTFACAVTEQPVMPTSMSGVPDVGR
jgi:hypothetical protein